MRMEYSKNSEIEKEKSGRFSSFFWEQVPGLEIGIKLFPSKWEIRKIRVQFFYYVFQSIVSQKN